MVESSSEKSLLLQFTGENHVFKIIDFLVDNLYTDFSKKQIAEGADISRASLFQHWHVLEGYGIVTITRSFGKTRLYTLNKKSAVTQKILELEKALIAEAMGKDSVKTEKSKRKMITQQPSNS